MIDIGRKFPSASLVPGNEAERIAFAAWLAVSAAVVGIGGMFARFDGLAVIPERILPGLVGASIFAIAGLALRVRRLRRQRQNDLFWQAVSNEQING